MRNQRIVRDVADRSGAAFGVPSRTVSQSAMVKLRARSLSKRPDSLTKNAPVAVRSAGVAGLKVHIDGLPVVLVFPFENVSQRIFADLDANCSDMPSLLSNTIETIISRLRAADSQVTVSLSGPAPVESNAQLQAVAASSGPQTILSVGPLELNLLDRTARRGDRPIDLRPREFQLLRYMMERRDKLLTRAKLLQEVWNYKFVPQTNLVDVHMGRLRRKIDGPNEPVMIRSVRGAGFVLNVNPLSQN